MFALEIQVGLGYGEGKTMTFGNDILQQTAIFAQTTAGENLA